MFNNIHLRTFAAILISLVLVVASKPYFDSQTLPDLKTLFVNIHLPKFGEKVPENNPAPNRTTTRFITPSLKKVTISPTRTPFKQITPTREISPTETPTPIIFYPTSTPKPEIKPTVPPVKNCPTSSQNSYGSVSTSGESFNAAASADINLEVRGWEKVNKAAALADYGGETDNKAPQFNGVVNNGDSFTNTYALYNWDFSTNSRTTIMSSPYPVTLLGLSSSIGQTVRVPNSGYDIGGGYQVMVLYASPTNITLKYTREDNIVAGYALHIEGLCVDPNLLSLYNQKNSSGRDSLPALRAGDIVGTASETEVKIAISDTGEFLDPRSRKDWWAGF